MAYAVLDRRSMLLGLGAAAAAPGLGWAQVAQGVGAIPGVPAARPESVGLSSAGLHKINAMMAEHIAANRITGGVTAVARRNKLVHFQPHGFHDWGAKTPMRPDAMFVMMSSTKPVTGVALLQQMELGRVSLSDPVSKYIPELKAVRGAAKPGTPRLQPGQTYTDDQLEPQAREITIRDLATHTSGLNAGPQRRPGETLAQYIPRLREAALDFQPGTRWAYSAVVGPDVLARVVEITSGQPYDQYLKQHIFDPIGMKDTAHNLTPEQSGRVMRRYVYENGAWATPRGGGGPPMRTSYFAGSYGLVSTARDYLLFETMLLNKGTIHGRRVLKPESVALMSSNLVGDLYRGTRGDTRGTGFGVQVRTVLDAELSGSGRSKGAFGWGGAYGTMSWTDPAEQLVAVLMIQQPVDVVQRDFQRVIRDAITA
ncbi:serine hydrolase domain-containing protein [Phenylobacterium sp.]|uniref:serine hydrolase domain-containing protein n=1 Tax=Phenylobacterium sp. TaxID=1871053 RepID=UPI002F947F53